jgi:hypothetical protein
MSCARSLAAVLAMLVMSSAVFAQSPAGVTRVREASSLRSLESNSRVELEANGPGSLAVEALAGSFGSAIGMGIVALAADCGFDDLGCELLSVGAGGIAGIVGATIGTTIAARQTGSSHSVLGAALGATVGTGVGLGIHYIFNRGTNRNLGMPVVVPIFVISQGTVAALGSRLLGK